MNKSITKKATKKSTATTLPATPPVASSSSTSATPSPIPSAIAPVVPIDAGMVTQCIALLGQIGGLLGPVIQLSNVNIMHSLKPRKGGAQVVTQLLALCNQHGITAVGPLSVQGMSDQLDTSNSLNEVGVQFDAVQKKLNDATFSAESTCWQYATALYTVLQRLALMDPTLAAGLQPVQAFFQTKKTKGTKRETKAANKVKAAAKVAAKLAPSATDTTAPAAATNGTSAPAAPAPAASTAAVVNGASH